MGGLRRGYSNATPPSDVGPKQSTAQRNQAPAVAKIAGRQGGKGLLLKQRKVEETGKLEKSSISIPTIIVKAPSTSSSGHSSQASSEDIEPSPENNEVQEVAPVVAPTPAPPQPPSIPSKLETLGRSTAQRERERFRDSRRRKRLLLLLL